MRTTTWVAGLGARYSLMHTIALIRFHIEMLHPVSGS
jgi:hypothetical protein